MATQKEGNKKKGNGVSVGVGVGITAALVSAAGAYFLYGSKDAAKNRKTVKSWTLRAKAEVLDGIEKAKDMTKEEYEELIDKTVKTYQKIKGASAEELIGFTRDMKSHWKMLESKGERRVAAIPKAAMKKVGASAAPRKAAPRKAAAKGN